MVPRTAWPYPEPRARLHVQALEEMLDALGG
jgi:hypothetical protein